jgi:hypothetical protein
MSGLLYKKNKYEILKRFLGDFVPTTSFVLGNVVEGRDARYAEYTVQDEVPRVSLSDLTPEQRNSPILENQVVDLMDRLKRMYEVLGQANARTSHGVSLDGKLDLGGVSDYVKAEDFDHDFNGDDARAVIDSNSSPNLLVNPDTMQLYCIDFDQGQWREGMDEAKALVFEIADRQDSTAIGHTAVVAATDHNQMNLFSQSWNSHAERRLLRQHLGADQPEPMPEGDGPGLGRPDDAALARLRAIRDRTTDPAQRYAIARQYRLEQARRFFASAVNKIESVVKKATGEDK